MAKLKVDKGAEEYISQLEKMNVNTNEAVKRVIYPVAGMVADEIKKNIQGIPVTTKRGTQSEPIDGITAEQKHGLLEGLGVSKFQTSDGVTHVRVGFSGYNRTMKTKSANIGLASSKSQQKFQPNVMIARSVEGGTYFRKKHPFVAPAVRKVKSKADEIMQTEWNKEIEALKK